MERCARSLAKSVQYVGAATVEYLYDLEANKYYFLELNPRLQVKFTLKFHAQSEGYGSEVQLYCSRSWCSPAGAQAYSHLSLTGIDNYVCQLLSLERSSILSCGAACISSWDTTSYCFVSGIKMEAA